MGIHLNAICGRIHVRSPYYTHIRTFFLSNSCVWMDCSVKIHACMHAHTDAHINSTVFIIHCTHIYQDIRIHSHARDTDRQTAFNNVCVRQDSSLFFTSFLLFLDNPARIDLQATQPIFFFSFRRREKNSEGELNWTWACVIQLNLSQPHVLVYTCAYNVYTCMRTWIAYWICQTETKPNRTKSTDHRTYEQWNCVSNHHGVSLSIGAVLFSLSFDDASEFRFVVALEFVSFFPNKLNQNKSE